MNKGNETRVFNDMERVIMHDDHTGDFMAAAVGIEGEERGGSGGPVAAFGCFGGGVWWLWGGER